MEFAHLIKTPRVEKVVIHRPLRKPVEGALCITGHHLIFSAGGENPDELWVLQIPIPKHNGTNLMIYIALAPSHRLC